MGDPHNPGDLTITIKYGKGYDESWAVFRGTAESVRRQLSDYFAIDAGDTGTLTLHELVLNCTKIAHGGSAASSIGTVLPKNDGGEAKAGSGDAWSQAEAQASEPGPNPLIAQVRATETVQALQRLWAENKSAFDEDADLMAAYKEHGKTLQAQQQAGI